MYYPGTDTAYEKISRDIDKLETQAECLKLVSLEAGVLVSDLVQKHVTLDMPETLQEMIADCVDDILYPYLDDLETEITALSYEVSVYEAET